MRHALQLIPTSVHGRVAQVEPSKAEVRCAMGYGAGCVREVALWPPKSAIYSFQASFTSRLRILV